MYVLTFPLQVIALGLILHRGSYLRSFFNIVDCFVVISSLIPILYYITRTPPTTNRYYLITLRTHLSSYSITYLVHVAGNFFGNFHKFCYPLSLAIIIVAIRGMATFTMAHCKKVSPVNYIYLCYTFSIGALPICMSPVLCHLKSAS